MTTHLFTPRAERGLLSQLEHAAEHGGPEAAEATRAALLRAVEDLARHPRMGHFRDDLTADRTLRFWSVGGVLIAYRWAARPIELVLIERGEMDWRVWLQALDDDPDLTPR